MSTTTLNVKIFRYNSCITIMLLPKVTRVLVDTRGVQC
jgi:hypothetical protein